jgi:hypothetical protein
VFYTAEHTWLQYIPPVRPYQCCSVSIDCQHRRAYSSLTNINIKNNTDDNITDMPFCDTFFEHQSEIWDEGPSCKNFSGKYIFLNFKL